MSTKGIDLLLFHLFLRVFDLHCPKKSVMTSFLFFTERSDYVKTFLEQVSNFALIKKVANISKCHKGCLKPFKRMILSEWDGKACYVRMYDPREVVQMQVSSSSSTDLLVF